VKIYFFQTIIISLFTKFVGRGTKFANGEFIDARLINVLRGFRRVKDATPYND